MEYRGYDSAGLEIEGDEPGKPVIFKEVGKVQVLKKHCFDSSIDMDKNFLSQTSIAHTRSVALESDKAKAELTRSSRSWATHGAPSS